MTHNTAETCYYLTATIRELHRLELDSINNYKFALQKNTNNLDLHFHSWKWEEGSISLSGGKSEKKIEFGIESSKERDLY